MGPEWSNLLHVVPAPGPVHLDKNAVANLKRRRRLGHDGVNNLTCLRVVLNIAHLLPSNFAVIARLAAALMGSVSWLKKTGGKWQTNPQEREPCRPA
jgi:hypothetical protein